MNGLVAEHVFGSGVVLQLAQGDITLEQVDAIVNAANARLVHGGGLAGAILRQGGYAIQSESDAWVRRHGLVTHDHPAYTGAGNLPCRYVIHAVGPMWGEGDENFKLASAVTGALQVAVELKLSSLALPAISTGIFGFPVAPAATSILSNIVDFFASHPGTSLRLVRVVELSQDKIEIFQQAWDGLGLGSKPV